MPTVSTSSPSSGQLPGRLAARLVAARRSRFVGREAELVLLRAALLQEQAPFVVLHVHGPGGVGKSALLRTYAQLAHDSGRLAVYLDGRTLEISPAGFLRALRQELGLPQPDDPLSLPTLPATCVLLLDTYETISALDEWLRQSFLPQLPEQWLIVTAGRNAPDVAWYTDVEWAGLTRIISLRNLRPEESETFLTTRGVPADHHAALLALSHGHPLALCLLAEAIAQGKAVDELSFRQQPDLVRLLIERCVDEIPSAKHRLALEACVMVWSLTESLLNDLLGAEEGSSIFAWLRRLPFIEQSSAGIFPHDLARDVLEVDFRWRNAEGHRQLYSELVRHLQHRLQQAGTLEQQRIWFDILYLARHSAYMGPYFDWQALGASYAEMATAADLPAILAMVEQNEGSQTAKLAAYWFQRQPRAFRVFRRGNTTTGFMAHLAVQDATAEEIATDPALAPALAYVARYGPLHPGEEIAYMRFWMDGEAFQAVSPAINLTAINASIHWTTHPKLAWNFIATYTPAHMQPHFKAIHMHRTPEADFVVGGHCYGVFSHDWRVETAEEWLAGKPERYSASEFDLEALSLPKPTPTQPLIVLSEPEFVEAVRQALRDYTRADLLRANPLLRSRLVAERASDRGGDWATQALQTLLRENVESLKSNPKDEKLYRALWSTYFEPAATQEQAAAALDLPFSTYRYHLTSGVDRVVARLWQLELQGKRA